MELSIPARTKPVSDKLLLNAIRIRQDPHFPALNICNALAGTQTDEWLLIRKYSLNELLEERKQRGL